MPRDIGFPLLGYRLALTEELTENDCHGYQEQSNGGVEEAFLFLSARLFDYSQ